MSVGNLDYMGDESFFESINSLLSGHELEILGDVKAFCQGEFSSQIHTHFLERKAFPGEWIQKWADQGMLGLQVPKALGGKEASFACKVRVAQEVARHGFAPAFALNNLQGSVTRLARDGSISQKNALLEKMLHGEILGAPAFSEPNGGTDLGALQMQAKRVPEGWLLNGTKAWITNGTIVNCPIVLARVDDGSEANNIGSFLVPMKNEPTVIRESIQAQGIHSFRCANLEFRDHFIPEWCQFSAAGEAFKSSLASINMARVHVAAMCVATLHSSLCESINYCNERQTFGKPLLMHQGLRWELAEVAIRLEAASALVARAVQSAQYGTLKLALAAQAKKFAVDTSLWGIDQLIRAMGAVGTSTKHRLCMNFDEVRLAAFADGTNEILQDRVGRELTKSYLGKPRVDGGWK